MAVAHSAASESHTGTAGSISQTSFSWTHTQTGTPQGVLVFVHVVNSAGNPVSSVTYGSVTLTRVTGGAAIDTAGEPGRTDLFFAGSGLASGNQTITVNRANTTDEMYASAATVTAATNTNVTGIVLLENDGTMAQQSVNDGSPGTNSLRYAAAYSGLAAPPTTGANSTSLTSIDFGNYAAAMVRETTAGQGARLVGFTTASDDRAAVHVAVRELFNRTDNAVVGTFTLTGNPASILHNPRLDGGTGTFSLTGNPATTLHNPRLDGNTGTFTLNGNPATLSKSRLFSAATGTFTFTGNPATSVKTVARTLPVTLGSFTLSGNPTTLRRTYQLSASIGLFTLTGNPSTLKTTRALSISAGAFYLTGNPSTLNHTYFLQANTGLFTSSGSAIAIRRTYTTTANTGTFTFTGNSATLTKVRVYTLDTTAGTFALTGNPATFNLTRNLQAATGTFSLNGNAASTLKNTQLHANTAAFALTGNTTAFTRTYVLPTTKGLYALTGNDITLTKGAATARTLDAATGTFIYTGNPATLTIYRNKTAYLDTGAFSLTGNPATFAKGLKFAVSPATYVLTGNPIAPIYAQRRRVILIF